METILSGGIHILSRDTSAPPQVAGWGPDTEGHVGRIKPYCLQIDVFSKTDPTHPPSPPHVWTVGVIRDILIRFVSNVWE